MTRKAAAFCSGLNPLLLSFALLVSLRAQPSAATVSGTVRGPSEVVVPNAGISVTNRATGQSVASQTNAAGLYTVPGLAPGDYDISVSAPGFQPKTAVVTLTSGEKLQLDLSLIATSSNVAPPLSLGDLGFPPDQTQGSAQDQARLDRRSHMLKLHQRFGLLALVPLIATIASSNFAGGRHPTPIGRDVHGALGAVTADMYFTAAYFALRAPRIPGTPTRGPIRLHKALAWVHVPGMILTPILGAMAFSQESHGERVHGIAKAHGAVADVTYAAFGLAVVAVSFKF
jgi:hypothetical protein